ncbi:MAG: hypothetical protein ACRD4P_07780 [Bryobacteraceae bacterium]
MRTGLTVVVLALSTGAAFCQNSASNMIVGAGYSTPVPVNVAPGQLMTLFVRGVGQSLTQPVAAARDGNLPKSLAGISVTLRQGSDLPVPILEVRPVSTCIDASQAGCGTLTAITVEIPFEIQTLCPLCERPVGTPQAELFVSEDGTSGALIGLNPFDDQVHILTSCDTVVPNAMPGLNLTGLPCPPVVTHGDGSLVSSTNPAKPGEQIVAYAVGLGKTNPAVATGEISSTSAPTVSNFALDFNFRPNALPAKPLPQSTTGDPPPPIAPIFTGLTAEYAGLYQINFLAPQAPPGTPSCGNAVQSNLTVSIGGAFSFDGAGICIAVSP